MPITNINSWEGMRVYLLQKLGWPVNNVEITEEQLDLAIEDTIREFWYYNTDRGNYMDYIIFQCSAGVSEYSISAGQFRDYFTSAVIDDIEAIYDLSVREGLEGLNTLFSPQHILLYDVYVTQGGYPGGPVDNAGIGMTLTNYYTSMMYIEQIREAFGKMYRADWIPNKRVIKVIPTPVEPILGVVVAYRRQLAEHLFNDPLVRKLALAKAKIQWGRNLIKYGGSLPDGLTINADVILNEGKEEEEKYLEWMRSESEPPDFFIA